MQTTKPNIPAALKGEEAKRTTIILERSEREYIEQLIKDGKEPGIKPLISKMLDIYKSLNMDDWQFPGEYYCGISRIAIINVEMINIFTQYIPKEKLPELGTRMGDALKVSIQSTLGLDPAKKRKLGIHLQTPKNPRPRRPLPTRQIHTNKNPSYQRIRHLEGTARNLTWNRLRNSKLHGSTCF